MLYQWKTVLKSSYLNLNWISLKRLQNITTTSASKNFAFVEEANSKSYGIDSIRYQAVIIWNKLRNNIASDLTELNRMKVKPTIIERSTQLKILLNIDEPIRNIKKSLILHELIQNCKNLFSFSLFHILSFLLFFFLQSYSSPSPYSVFTSLPFLFRIAIWLY